MAAISHKRGDTFDNVFYVLTVIPDGFLHGWAMASHMRTRTGLLVSALTPEWLDAPVCRALRLTCPDTTQWPVDALEFDVQWTSPAGFIVSCKTLQCRVLRDQTIL